jgi:filamentous hemagglutinin family protein
MDKQFPARPLICYLLFAICYSSPAPTQAGDILRGNSAGNNSSAATSTFFGGNQAAMNQLQKNANDILTRASQAMKSVQAMQQAARNAALQVNSNVPNGLITGGLQIATGKNAEWQGAKTPTQSVAGGQTTVTIQQTSSQAILNWQTFNVGKNTTVDFNQSAGGVVANTWVALNRILDSSGKPSQILGSIKAQGQVYLINRNGIIFGGASQINVSSLVAAAAQITDSQFTTNGVYSPVSAGNVTPSFSGGLGAVIVEGGAQIVTNSPLRIADRGGSVILLGRSVENDGSITTNNGQTILAAGKEFDLLPGYSVTPANSTSGNLTSTTLGTEVAVTDGGTALNNGLIQAKTGDITIVGHQVTQAGFMISSSSVDQRGTIHLLTDTSDTKATVTLAPGSITYIEPDPNSGTALDPQRTNAYQEDFAHLGETHLNDFALLPDRIGLSRIEITTGGTVDFASGSLTSATAGQIEVSAGKRIFTGSGAELDVSGLVNVSLPMSANNLAVNIQGFEQRDDPLNRDTKLLNNSTVYVDLRQLQEVPANPSYVAPYNTENRFYTPGGVLEVSGELNNVGHSIDEWDTVGGSITLSANQVVSQTGSVFDIAGGSIKYQAGYLKQSYLIGSDGRIYNVNTAPAGIIYLGVFNGFVVNHPRWNVTETYQNVITQPSQIYQAGYTEGRDAGSLTIDAATSIFEGTINAKTIDGPQQNSARPSNVTDPFLLTQSTVTLNGTLDVGPYGQGTSSEGPLYSSNVIFNNSSASLTSSLTATSSIDRAVSNTNTFSVSEINSAALGGLTVDVQAAPPKSPLATNPEQASSANAGSGSKHQGKGNLIIEAPLVFADGAQIFLTAANVVIDGGITAPDGNVTIDSVSYAVQPSNITSSKPAKPIAGITLESGATIDTEGLWTNASLDPLDITGEAYINGGNVTLSSNQGITLATGSLIDASSGAALLPNLKTLNGTGGNITIEADQVGNVSPSPSSKRTLLRVSQAISRGPLILDGTLRSYGVKAGGALTLQAYSVVIGDGVTPAAASQLVLSTSFFSQGFSGYTIHGMASVTVEPGATIDVTEPVYQITPGIFKVATGVSPATALGTPLLMPVYVGNADTGTVIQRPGASLSLLAGVNRQVSNPPPVGAGGTINIAKGSTIQVDPGQSINVEAADQITVDGTLQAPAGSIEIVNYRSLGGVGGKGKNISYEPGELSIWIGGTLDVAAQGFVTFDRFGRPYGVVPNGGSIVLGSTGGTDSNGDLISTDAFVIIRPGATLDASGTHAVLDLNAGANPLQNMIGPATTGVSTDPVQVSSNGGSISLSSYDGIYVNGSLRAAAGGPGGAGGTLVISFIGPDYAYNFPPFTNNSNPDLLIPNNLRQPRTITIGQQPVASPLPSGLQPGQANPKLKVGYAYVSADAIAGEGFANLSFYASSAILFKGDVTLSAGESIKLFDTSIADTSRNATVAIVAPYVLFGGTTGLFQLGFNAGSPGTPLTNNPAIARVKGNAVLTVEADLIDLAYTAFGDNENVPVTTHSKPQSINFPAFKEVNFVSQGDIRFLSDASIKTPGSFTFTAAQLYPVTGATATVEAGFLASNNVLPFAPHTSISINRISGVDPTVPQSVFGQLTFEADTIDQGGIVQAPLGAITFGINGSKTSPNTSEVNFLSGSITSVSANGLTIPYGGTTDGVTYTVNGQTFTTQDVIAAAFSSSRGIAVEGGSVSVAKGALLDLSGGGALFGEGFISGRGGSLDVLSTALVNQNPSNTFSAPGNTVYALVPGVQTSAPSVVDTNTVFNGSMPGIGQQITVPVGVPGLPAGTYTLMPSNYALLPGAFRVELGGRGNSNQPSILSLENGSYEVNVNLGIANTGIRSALPTEAIITPASVVETYSQYDLETYSAVAISQAKRFNQPRPVLPVDGSTLTLDLGIPVHRTSQLNFDGTADFSPASGGYSGALVIGGTNGGNNIEITGPNDTPTKGWVSFSAAAVDAIGAPNIYIGGSLVLGANTSPTAQAGTFLVGFEAFFGFTQESVAIRTGAVVTAADVFLIAGGTGSITIESGASIDTLGRGAPAFDSTSGYFFTNQVQAGSSQSIASVLAVSNGYLNILPSSGANSTSITVNDGASLFSDGTIAFATNVLNLGEKVNYGGRYIGFSSADINIGTIASLAAAEKRGTLPPGILLDQTVLDQLLAGDPAGGAPALQILTLSAAQSINFYGSVDLNTIDPNTGKSTLKDLVLDTPAAYGAGSGSDSVTITTGTLIWNGLAQIGVGIAGGNISTYTDTPPGPVIPNGPGTGFGTLNIVANEIVFGYSPMDRPQNLTSLGRLVLGFSAVNLTASQEITANSKGTFSVYQTETGPATYTGGNLNLMTSMLTGAPGSVLSYKTGGVLTLSPPAGVLPTNAMSDSLGAEINLTGNTITISSSILAVSGKVTLTASGDIILDANSRIDVSGLTVSMFDQKVPTFGGDVSLESTQGNITQDALSVINVSAIDANAGSLTITATGASAGIVSLGGTVLGSSTGNFDSGSFDLRAQNPGDFTALNQLLDTGGFFWSRSFDIKQGSIDIAAGTTITAHTVTISVDNGSLTIGGTINAGGTTPGTIRLSSGGNLELQSTGVLDVHSTSLLVDSYGQPIYAENQGTIELTVADGTDTSVSTLNNGTGTLVLDAGATINMSSPDGIDRGDLELNVPRTAVTSGDIRIQASSPLNITGAQTIAVNAFWTYAPTDANGTIVQSAGKNVPTGAIILDQVNQDSTTFITNAEPNGALNSTLRTKLAGLLPYLQALHLRPGVEIVSPTPTGNLTVLGDLDLSQYRYASINPNSPLIPNLYGSGEPGVLILRAGGDLNIYGSINDGFAPLNLNGTPYPDEKGWVLFAGIQTLSNVVIQTTITLMANTTFPNSSVTLNYAIPFNNATLNPNVVIPLTVTLSTAQTVNVAFIAKADITIPGGKVFHAGQIVPANTPLPAGTTLASGSVLPFSIAINASNPNDLTSWWPAGAALSDFTESISLPLGAVVQLNPGDLIPSGTNPGFGGPKSVATRPAIHGIQGQIYAVEPMLGLGTNGQVPLLSWSIRLVAGADTGAAETRTLQAQTTLNGSGNLILDDPHYTPASRAPIFSVIRTGTGYLDLLAGGNFTEDSLYGIYTAGTEPAGIDNSLFSLPRVAASTTLFGGKFATSIYETIAVQDYQAYYPDGGGNVLVAAQGNLTGFSINGNASSGGDYVPTYSIGDWLWRQGGVGINQNTAWWINFGTYVPGTSTGAPMVTGFTGIGTLGGGNLTILAGGNAGGMSTSNGTTSTSLFVAVGGTGRVTSLSGSGTGSLIQTGGGDVTIKIGGELNPGAASYLPVDNGFDGGEFVDLRGKVNISAGSIGGIDLIYGQSSSSDPRPTSVSTASVFSFVFGGPVLAPGDATIDLQVRGDLVIGTAADPGRVPEQNTTPAVFTADGTVGQGESWFSLWTQATAISLFSAGGNILPVNTIGSQLDGVSEVKSNSLSPTSIYHSYIFPSRLSIIATSGSIYAGSTDSGTITYNALELAPSPSGQLELLAENSIYANASVPNVGFTAQPFFFDISGAQVGSNFIPNPFNAAFYLNVNGIPLRTNTNPLGSDQSEGTSPGDGQFNLFAFEADSATGTLHAGDPLPARIYAVTGDIVSLQVGENRAISSTPAIQWYVAAKATDIRAGGDIVNFGQSESIRSLILNNSLSDVSVLSAGNEILFANVDIAGPGNLELSAGGDVYQGAQGAIESIGLVGTPKITNPDGGAGIIVLAGVGSAGPNWAGFANLYLNPANVADPNLLLTDQPGKVVATYQNQLLTWLRQTYGFTGSATAALAFFESLPIEQQSVFLLKVYFSELDETGLAYNDPTNPFFHTYIRGNEAIATLFPTTGSNGQKITYNGSLTMLSSAPLDSNGQATLNGSILTDFGGGITTVVPGGQTIAGVTGVAPGAHAGILTQGSGDIDMYSGGSVLLGESRVLTTFGGNIVIWSATGDINAGIGAKGTVIFAPPGIVYDEFADIFLSPTVPTSGAGIGTLAPIPDVPPGNVNLIAPEGTIDAGEAGIRASGNANLVARVIVNAANISVAGKTTGIPTIVSPNVAAITAASNAVGSSTNAAEEVAKQQATQSQEPPESVIIVEVLGYGGGDSDQ